MPSGRPRSVGDLVAAGGQGDPVVTVGRRDDRALVPVVQRQARGAATGSGGLKADDGIGWPNRSPGVGDSAAGATRPDSVDRRVRVGWVALGAATATDLGVCAVGPITAMLAALAPRRGDVSAPFSSRTTPVSATRVASRRPAGRTGPARCGSWSPKRPLWTSEWRDVSYLGLLEPWCGESRKSGEGLGRSSASELPDYSGLGGAESLRRALSCSFFSHVECGCEWCECGAEQVR